MGSSSGTWRCSRSPVLLAVGFPIGYVVAFALDVVGFPFLALFGGWLLAVGIALLVGAAYRYPSGEFEVTTVRELLTDIYASPVDGGRVELSGEHVGRGSTGYRFSENLMLQD